jgi:repressor LexA
MAKERTRDRVLNFITAFKRRKGYAPTVKEIADNCTITSLSVVQYHLDQLEQAGLIKREKNKSRSISTVGEPKIGCEVPLLGVIAAGHPIGVPDSETWETAANRIEVPAYIVQGRQGTYALEVRGNSMVDAMIGDGDVVIMHHTYDVKNGDVVAAWLKNEQEVTLKKIYFEGDQVRLQPCNPFMMPFYQPATNVEVQGKVIGVIRTTDISSATR